MAESDLIDALGLGGHELIALVGGGGKTTMLFALGRQLTGRVILTTTTKMGADETRIGPILVAPTDQTIDNALAEHHKVLAWSAVIGEKAVGVSPETVNDWFDRADHVVVEADGSRRRPFKAPAGYEPVIPDRSTFVGIVMGSRALGKPIGQVSHRPERVTEIAKCDPTDLLTPARAARVICHAEGGLRNVPSGARAVLIVTGVDDENRTAVEDLAEQCHPVLSDVVTIEEWAHDPSDRAW